MAFLPYFLGSILPMPVFLITITSLYIGYISQYLLPNCKSPPLLLENEDSLLNEQEKAIFLFIILHYLILVFFIAYFRTFWTNPGEIPVFWDETILEELAKFDFFIQKEHWLKYNDKKSRLSKSFELNPNNNSDLDRNALSELNSSIDTALFQYQPLTPDRLAELEDKYLKEKGFDRICNHCNRFKPPRTHHCSVCSRCVLKMDHHCPWVLNCIGFYNYKFFFNMLIYGEASILLMTISFSSLIIKEINNPEGSYKDLIVNSSIWGGLFIISILLTYFISIHIGLVLKGRTTIENYDKKGKDMEKYDLGARGNFLTVFGQNPWLWFFPVMVCEKEDGVFFKCGKK